MNASAMIVTVALVFMLVSPDANASITEDQKELRILAYCSTVLDEKAADVLEKDVQRLDAVYKRVQREINSRYSAHDVKQLWADAMAFAATPSAGAKLLGVQGCRRFIDDETKYYRLAEGIP